MACKSYIGRFEKGKERIFNRVVKQCHYCESFLAKNDEAMKRHLSICAAREGITYAFDNGQVITFQDNFKYLGDVSFTVYFNFEAATTSDSVFFDPKVFAVSFCQVHLFHPFLNLDKIAIFGSFQEIAEEIYDLSHFKQEHVPFSKKNNLLLAERCCLCSVGARKSNISW